MQYQELKKEDSWQYYGAGVFGELEVDSTQQLDGDKLDGILNLLVTDKGTEQERNGTIKISDDHIISYRFKKTLPWGDEAVQPIDTCNTNTPTSTKQADSESTGTPRGITRLINWLRRFVGAFLEAWRSTREQQKKDDWIRRRDRGEV